MKRKIMIHDLSHLLVQIRTKQMRPLSLPVPRGVSCKAIQRVFPIHEQETLKVLKRTWVRNVLRRQPIGNVGAWIRTKLWMGSSVN